VQVTAPFREIRELAARVEQEKGVLEDLVVEAQSAASDELTARFRMTALELNPDGKRIVDRALATVGRPGGGRPPALSLPLPRSDGVANLRDPFSFSPAAPPPRRGPTAPPADSTVARAPATERPAAPRSERAPEKPETPETPMELRGIVGFPGGYLAIVNNQIVKVGDSVAGHRVDRIGEREVVLRAPEGNTRVVPLPTVGAASAPVPGAAPGPAGPAPPATPPTGPAAEPGR
jgi:hypothetical protein